MSRPVKELHDRQSTVKHDGNGSISAIAMEMAGKLEVELGNFSLLHFYTFHINRIYIKGWVADVFLCICQGPRESSD